MIVYADSSAFIKLYVNEPESAAVHEAFRQAREVYIQLIGYAEICAALARAMRMRRLSADELRHQIQRLDRDWESVRPVFVTSELVRRAGTLAVEYGLRGYDAVHLAAAEAVGARAGGLDMRVAVFDAKLRRAVHHLGMRCIDGA